jgi:pilus assembly protein FimV
MHRTASPSLLIGALLMTVAVGAHALGFGRSDGQHLLGQPLTFRIPLNLDADESIGAECAAAEVLAGDQRVPADSVRATIVAGNEPGERVLRITTRASIDEPVVTVTAAVGCPTRLSRRFVLFLDPPTVQIAEPAREAPAPAPAAAAAPAASAPEPAAAAAPSVPAARPEGALAPAKRSTRSTAARRTSLPAPVATARAPRERVRAAAPAASAAPARSRLQLEPLEPMVRGTAPVVTAAAPTVVADAAAQAASAARAASDANDRVRALEESLARLKNESKAAQDNMAEMRARLRAAEGPRTEGWLVYGLVGLVLLLIVLLGLLMRQRSRERQAMWWAAGQAAAGAAQEPEPPAPAKPSSRMPLARADSGPAPLTTTPAALLPTQPVPMSEAEPRREVTVEELIDLEQQAEFFLVLGQDDAAIDLLMGHLRSTGGSSPLPYLKLLEIYRRRNEREPYERMRERFNQRFNAHAPAWETDFAHGRALEDYPEVIARVQSLWRMPSLAMRELESLLFRQDQQVASFDLPAYREVLFLYSMARDLAQEETNGGGVDLLLPIGDDTVEQPVPLIPDVPASELHIDLDLGPESENEVTQGHKPIGRP